MQTNIYFWSYLAQFFLEWEIFLTNVVEEIKTHILFSVPSYENPAVLWDNVEKYSKARQATNNNTAFGHFMPDT